MRSQQHRDAKAQGEPEAKAKSPTRLRAMLSGIRARAWAALSGASARLWRALGGVVPKLKAISRKVLGACASWWKKRSKRAKLGLALGGASGLVAIGLAVFLVLFFRPVFVVEVFETQDAVVSGDDVVLSAQVTNKGRTGGSCELRALVDGQTVETERMALDAGAQRQVSMTLSGLPAGHHDIALAGWPGSAQQVWVMKPADFDIDGVKIKSNPMDLAATDVAEVLVGVTNVGEVKGSYEVRVALDGKVVETRKIELEGGLHADETFAVKIAKPGPCEVAVNGVSASLMVYNVKRPDNGTELVRRLSDGTNRLAVINDYDDEDCVVVLTAKGEDQPPLLAVYVRAGSTCTVPRIGDGAYMCYYELGGEWCTYRRAFTKTSDRGRFVESMEVQSPGWSYTEVALEFGPDPAPAGESPATEEPSAKEEPSETEDLSVEDFPDISSAMNAPLKSPAQPTTAPSARMFHQMVYDVYRGQMTLFGGMTGVSFVGNEQLDDTWSYDSTTNTWTLLQVLGDVYLGRGHSSLVYDLRSGKTILFGGMSSFKKPLNDTWSYDRSTNTWTNLRPSGAVPSPRSDQAMVYDSETGKVILFGGFDGDYLNDTWAYDPAANTWTRLWPTGGPPLGRCRHSLIYDPASHKVILYGGLMEPIDLRMEWRQFTDMWAYDPAANTWTQLRPSGDLPPGRVGPSLFYDPTSARIILFGGEIPWMEGVGVRNTRSLNDMWAYDPAAKTWTKLKPSGDLPPAREYASLVYDYDVGKAILFGGANGSTIGGEHSVLEGSIALNDTWAYDPVANTWTKLHPGDPVIDLGASGRYAKGGRPPAKAEMRGIVHALLAQQVPPLNW